MRRTVLLRHDRPDGAFHFDWLFALDEEGSDEPLRTYRAPCRPDEAAAGEEIPLERLPDHRSIYLEYEGPISGDRGSVTRIAEGRYCIEGSADWEQSTTIRIDWSNGRRQRWRIMERSGRLFDDAGSPRP